MKEDIKKRIREIKLLEEQLEEANSSINYYWRQNNQPKEE